MAVALGCLICFQAAGAAEVIEEGQSQILPWSGYWWPHFQGALLGPLSKYDTLTGSAAADWERQQHPSGAAVPRWHGYCHAWAASAVRETEPQRERLAGVVPREIPFGVGDQKGLLAVCHSNDDADSFGDRFGDGEGDDDPQDLAPDVSWRLLTLHVKQQGLPLILDVEAGPEVWNYPVYAYRIERQSTGADGECVASMTLWMADDAVPPDYVGIKVRRQSYQFAFHERNRAVVMGSGRWLGPSRKDHPDFAWYPFVARSDNPEIDYNVVKRLIESPTEQPKPKPRPKPKPQPQPQPKVDAHPQPHPRPKPEPPPEPRPQPEPGPGPKPEAKPESQPEPAPKPEAKPDRQTEPVSEASPAPNPPAGSEPKPEREPSPSADFDNPPQPSTAAGPQASPRPPRTVLSPWELVALIARKTSDFGLDVTVDRFDGGLYEADDALTVRATSERAGYLHLILVDSRGSVALLYPQARDDNRIGANQEVFVPGPASKYALRVAPPFGTARIKAVVCSRRLEISGLLPRSPTQAAGAPQTTISFASLPGFRWHPTQQALIRQLLLRYQQEKSLAPEQYGRMDARHVLGPFAQDEVAFYVGPKKGA